NASHPLEMSAATSRETMPIAMVSSQPMGSDPGWKSRPSAPTIAPTMMNQMKCMAARYPGRPGRKPQVPLASADDLGPFGLELLVGEDPRLVEVAELAEVRLRVVGGLGLLRL